MRKVIRFLIPALLLLFNLQPAFAEKYPYTPTELEFASLPNFCRLKLKPGEDRTASKTGDDLFGHDTWIHVHHYCQGLNKFNRYYRASDATEKRVFLSDAASEFTYMVGHLPPNSVLLADVYQNRGRVMLVMDKAQEGVADLQKALEINPKNMQAYLILADQFEKLKNKDKALQIISEGLRHAPTSKGMQRRYQALGGKLPFPEPYEKPGQQNTATETKAEADTATTDKAPPNSSARETIKPVETKPAIGIPGQPYCRFCPDTGESKPGSP